MKAKMFNGMAKIFELVDQPDIQYNIEHFCFFSQSF